MFTILPYNQLNYSLSFIITQRIYSLYVQNQSNSINVSSHTQIHLWFEFGGYLGTLARYHCGLETGLPETAVACLPMGVWQGLKRCIPDGNSALGSRNSEEVVTEVGLGEPEELGVDEGGGGGVIWGRCGGGGPRRPGGKPPCMGDCHEPPPWFQNWVERLIGIDLWPRQTCCPGPLSSKACRSLGLYGEPPALPHIWMCALAFSIIAAEKSELALLLFSASRGSLEYKRKEFRRKCWSMNRPSIGSLEEQNKTETVKNNSSCFEFRFFMVTEFWQVEGFCGLPRNLNPTAISTYNCILLKMRQLNY